MIAIIIAAFLFLFFSRFGWEGMDCKLRVKNHTEDTLRFMHINMDLQSIYIDIKERGRFDNSKFQPLTYKNYTYKINPNQRTGDCMFGGFRIGHQEGDIWKRYIERVEDKKLRFFVFDMKTLRSESWEAVLREEKYVKKKVLSLDDIEDRNWVICIDNI